MGDHDHELEREADKASESVKSGLMPALSAAVNLAKETAATVDAVVGFTRVIVADDNAVAPGQLRRTEFLRRLDQTVREIADPLLAKVGRSTADCAFITAWLDHYRDVAPDKLERAARIYTLSRPETAEDLLRQIGSRVRRSVETWLASGQITGIPALTGGDLASDSATIARKAEGSGSAARGSPRAVRSQLGPGRPLGGATSARMGRAFGTSFDHVRVHTDANAAAMAGKLSARAFTVGSDVAFAPGQFQPGTDRGDGMIAHELAHVVQQRGGSAATSSTAEHDADAAVRGAAQREIDPNAPVPQPKPTGLSLQRCGDSAPDSPVLDQKTIDAERVTHAGDVKTTTKQLHDALTKRDAIAANSNLSGLDLQHQLDAADGDIARLRKQLRDQGVQIADTADSTTDLNSRVLKDGNVDLTKYNPRLELSSNLAKRQKVPFGDETAMRVRLDYVPPGTPVEVEWRYKSPAFKQEYLFPGGPLRWRGSVLDGQLDAKFWSDRNVAAVLRSDDDSKLQIVAHVYLGGDAFPIADLTDTIQFTDEAPDEDITLIVTGGAIEDGPNRMIAAQGADLTFTPSWVPPIARYSLHWKLIDIANSSAPSELVPPPGPGEADKKVPFPKLGTFGVMMEAVGDLAGEDPWETHPDPDTSRTRIAAVRIQVLDADTFGGRVLDRLDAAAQISPRQELAGYVSGLQDKENESRRLASRSGDSHDLYESRADSLWKTKHDIEKKLPDAGKASPMPATDDEMAAGTLYASPVTTALVLPENKGAQPLSTYLTIRKVANPDGTSRYEAIVLDGTSSDAWTFEGSSTTDARSAALAAFADMKSQNPYPIAGVVRYRFQRAGWDPVEGSFTTTTNSKLAVHYVEKILEVTGYVAAALLMMFPEAVITKWIAMGLLVGSIGLSAVHIHRNLELGIPWYDSRNVIEGLSIIASVVGLSGSVMAGSAMKAFKLGVGRPLMFRAGNALILASAGLGVGTFVYTSSQAIAQVRAAIADPSLKDDEKLSTFLQVSMQLMAGGLMLFQSNKELFSNLRKTNFLKGSFEEGKVQFDLGTQMDLMAELRRTGWTPDEIKTMAAPVMYQRYLAAGQLREEVDPKRVATAVGQISDAALREQLLTNPEIWRALHNLDYSASALETHWRNYNRPRTPSKTLKSTTFAEYLATRGVSTELDTDPASAPSPKLTEAFPNWDALSTTAKQRTLLASYEPQLVAALDPASTALPPHVKAALEAVLNKDLLGGSTVVKGARSKLSSAVNEALASSVRTPADLEAVTKLVGGSGSIGRIGETFVDEHLVDKAHAARDKSQLVVTKDEVPELEVKESFRPDRLVTDAHYTLDVKTGYANTDLDLVQAKNYKTLREQSTKPGTQGDALRAQLGGELEGHAWLLLPGGEKPTATVAADKRAWLNKNGFAQDKVLFLGTDGKIYEAMTSGPPVERGTNIHTALGVP